MLSEEQTEQTIFQMDIKYMIDPGDGLVNEKTVYSDDRTTDFVNWLDDNYGEIYVFDIHIFEYDRSKK